MECSVALEKQTVVMGNMVMSYTAAVLVIRSRSIEGAARYSSRIPKEICNKKCLPTKWGSIASKTNIITATTPKNLYLCQLNTAMSWKMTFYILSQTCKDIPICCCLCGYITITSDTHGKSKSSIPFSKSNLAL